MDLAHGLLAFLFHVMRGLQNLHDQARFCRIYTGDLVKIAIAPESAVSLVT